MPTKFNPDKREDPNSPSNGERAEIADKMLAQLPDLAQMDVGTAISDAIADLLHLAHREGEHVEMILYNARHHFNEER